MISVGELVGYTLLPVAAILVASLVAIVRPAGPRTRSAIMHLGAGVVVAVVAIELLPPVIHSDSIVTVAIGFSAGAALMLVLRYLSGHADENSGGNEPESQNLHDAANEGVTSMIAAMAIDLVVDGVMLGLGFAAGERAGVLLAIALTLETASLGLAMATTLRTRGAAVRRILAVAAVLALSIAIGAAAGGFVLRYAPVSVLPGLLAFGSAALLFLVTEELLEEAHQVKETPTLTAMFFVGFLVLMVLEMAGAAH